MLLLTQDFHVDSSKRGDPKVA